MTRRYDEPAEVAGHLAVIADIARGAVEGGDPLLAPGASRVLARLSADRDFLVDWLGRDDVDPSVRWAAVHRLAELGDPSHIDAESERDQSVAGHHAALTARAVVPTAEAKAEMWERLMGGELGTHEFDAVGAGFWGWEQADLVGPTSPATSPTASRSPAAPARRWPTASATPSRGCRSAPTYAASCAPRSPTRSRPATCPRSWPGRGTTRSTTSTGRSDGSPADRGSEVVRLCTGRQLGIPGDRGSRTQSA